MELTKDNFAVYAAKHYDNPYCLSEQEFKSDLNKIRVIKKMVTDYNNDNACNLRLLVNHFILFYNVFSHSAATKILFFKLDPHHKPLVNSILTYLCLPIGEGNYNKELFESLQEEFDD